MKYCKKCRVSVPGDLHTCPLCQGDLSGPGEAGRTAFPVLPASPSLHKGLLRLIGLGDHCGGSCLHCGQFKSASKRLVVCFRGRRRHQFLAHFLDGRKKARKHPQSYSLAGRAHFRAGPALGLVDRRALELVGRFCHTSSAYRCNDRHGSHRPGDAAENPGLYPISDAGRHIRFYPVCPFAVWLPSSCLPLGGMRRGKHYFTGCAVPV